MRQFTTKRTLTTQCLEKQLNEVLDILNYDEVKYDLMSKKPKRFLIEDSSLESFIIKHKANADVIAETDETEEAIRKLTYCIISCNGQVGLENSFSVPNKWYRKVRVYYVARLSELL